MVAFSYQPRARPITMTCVWNGACALIFAAILIAVWSPAADAKSQVNSVTLASAPNPSTFGVNPTFTVQVAAVSGSPRPTGTVNMSDSLVPGGEGVDSFAFLPLIEGIGGSCAAGLIPVYRLFRGNARFPDNPNHRFITSTALFNDFVSQGWEGEGVKLCVPAS